MHLPALMRPFGSRLVLVTSLLGLLPVLRGDVLLQQNFDREVTGHLRPSTIRGVFPWEGREPKEFGWISVEGDKSSLTFHDSSELRNQSPTVLFSWKDPDPKSKTLALSWDYQIPVDGQYLAVHFIGGTSWDNSALVLLISNGGIIVHADQGDESRVKIGTYAPGQWQSILINLNEKARTFDVWLDGKPVLNGYPMLAGGPKRIESMVIAADASAEMRKGAPVLAVDNINVVSAE